MLALLPLTNVVVFIFNNNHQCGLEQIKITAGTILCNNLCTPSSALGNSLHQLLTVVML